MPLRVPVLAEKGREKRPDGFNSLDANNTAETEIERADAQIASFIFPFNLLPCSFIVLCHSPFILSLFLYIYPLSISSSVSSPSLLC